MAICDLSIQELTLKIQAPQALQVKVQCRWVEGAHVSEGNSRHRRVACHHPASGRWVEGSHVSVGSRHRRVACHHPASGMEAPHVSVRVQVGLKSSQVQLKPGQSSQIKSSRHLTCRPAPLLNLSLAPATSSSNGLNRKSLPATHGARQAWPKE